MRVCHVRRLFHSAARAAVVLAAMTSVAAIRGVGAQIRDRATAAKAVDSVVAAALKDGRAAGMSVAVVRGRDTIVMKGYGFADLEYDVPTPDRAIYEIGSVTKQFTAAAILQLEEQGKLSLDDDISKHLPDYPTQGHRITLRRLLDHTSGIKGYTEIPAFRTISTRKLPKDSLVAIFAKEKFDFAPGEGMVYNNSAYFLLGMVIEKLSGKSYGDYVSENLFKRAGMTDSRYCSENAVYKRRAHGYDMSQNVLVRAGYMDHTYPYSAGSLCSTVGDLVAWTRALHEGRILGAKAYQTLVTPNTLNDGTRLRYAGGLASHSLAGHRVIEHGGGINGFLSEAAYFPDDSAIIVVLINTAGPVSPMAVTTSIAEVVLGKRPAKSERFSGDVAALAGTYKGVGRGREMVVTVRADSGVLSLQLAPQPSSRLRYVGGDTFENDQGGRFTFVREGGRVTKLRADLIYGYSVLAKH